MTPEQLAAIRERVDKAATKGCGDFYCFACECGPILVKESRALLAYVEELEKKAAVENDPWGGCGSCMLRNGLRVVPERNVLRENWKECPKCSPPKAPLMK